MQPTTVVFQSPDHNSLNPNGTFKIDNYTVLAASENNPATVVAQVTFPRNEVMNAGADYSLPLAVLMDLLPPNFGGWLFVRGTGSSGIGPWGVGQQFFKTTVPEACNVVAIL